MNPLARAIIRGAAAPVALTRPTADQIAAYDARSFVSVDGGLTASTWTDLTGNGFHATQSVAAQRPDITTSDGYESLYFDGDDNFVTSITSTAGPLTVYSVEKRDTSVATYSATFESNNGGGGRLLVGRMDTGNYGIFDGSRRDSGIAQGTTRSQLTFEAAVVGASRVWRNGSAGSVAGLSSLKALGSNPRIGREATGAFSYFIGHMHALFIYGAARNAGVEAYTTQEWAVP